MLLNTILMALSEIRRNALRSFLTMLGVIIGVGSVIALVTVGDGTTASVKRSISSLGENLLMVRSGADRRGITSVSAQPFEEKDAHLIKTQITGASAVAPSSTQSLLAVAGGKNWRTSVTGTVPDYFTARGYEIAEGRPMTSGDVSAGRSACWLGATVAKELFGQAGALNQALRLGKLSCEVVGILKPKGAGAMGVDNDDVVLIPLKAFQQRIVGNRDIQMIYVSVAKDRSTTTVKQQLELLLREHRRIGPGQSDDFTVGDVAEIVEAVSATTGALTALLAAIAAVSLFVGGIGIMNIMLVNVTERTREIGIRLAIGAVGQDVLLQFLIEAITLSTLGGLIGVALGLGAGYLATHAMAIPFTVSMKMVVLAFSFSAFVGVLFGYLPARKAAQLNPIDALRHE